MGRFLWGVLVDLDYEFVVFVGILGTFFCFLLILWYNSRGWVSRFLGQSKQGVLISLLVFRGWVGSVLPLVQCFFGGFGEFSLWVTVVWVFWQKKGSGGVGGRYFLFGKCFRRRDF